MAVVVYPGSIPGSCGRGEVSDDNLAPARPPSFVRVAARLLRGRRPAESVPAPPFLGRCMHEPRDLSTAIRREDRRGHRRLARRQPRCPGGGIPAHRENTTPVSLSRRTTFGRRGRTLCPLLGPADLLSTPDLRRPEHPGPGPEVPRTCGHPLPLTTTEHRTRRGVRVAGYESV